MACKAYRWPATPEQVRARIAPAFANGESISQAARSLGTSDASLRSLLRHHRIDWRDLRRAAPVPPVPYVPPPSEPDPEPPPLIDWTGARSSSSGVERRVILGDLHVPFHSLPACSAALALIRLIQPQRIVQLGDLWNMGAVSHHPRPFGGRENHAGALAQGRAFLEALRKAAPGAEIRVLMGNHDRWGEEYEDENPQMAGLVTAHQILDCERLGIQVHTSIREPLVLGPVAYHHGYGGGEHFAKRYATDDAPKAGVSCYVVAHHHTLQLFSARNGCECWGAGWLGRPDPSAFSYAKNNGGWRQSLLVQDIAGEMVTTTPVKLEGGRALFSGRLVGAA